MGGDLRVHNARIWTGRPDRPWARTLSIARGRIVAVDHEGSGGEERGPVIDARGRTVAPGLIDAHLHLLLGGLALTQPDLSGVRGREEFEAVIEQWHRRLPEGEWIVAHGWSNENWTDTALPDASWLAVAGDRPVVCHRSDLHAALVNERVLAMCDASTCPPGGWIVRDAVTGTPTGLFIEAAAWQLINPLIPEPTVQRRREALLAAQSLALRLGLTAVGSMEYQRQVEEVFVPLRERLTLRCRITLLDRHWPLDVGFGRDFTNDERLAVVGYKAFVDGTLGSRSARMLEPYGDAPNQRGALVELAAEGHLVDWARAVAAAELSPAMHAIGDEAVRLALDAARAVDPRVRPRIEHAQHIASVDVPRMKGILASMQPLHKAEDGVFVQARLGPQRMKGSFAFRTLLRAGGRLAFGSDWPVVSCDPLAGIRAAVTGLTCSGELFLPEENLTVDEALAAYTAGAAHALGMEASGVIRPGAWGDLVIFDRDPFGADWIHAPPAIATTIAAGEVVYDGGDVATRADASR